MGRKKWEPTDEQRAQIRALAQHGIPQEEIAAFVGCDPKTLRRRCKAELAESAKGKVKLKMHAYQRAFKSDIVMMFYLKTQCGWRENMQTADADTLEGEFVFRETKKGERFEKSEHPEDDE